MERPDILVVGGSGFLGRAILAAAGPGRAIGTYHARVPAAAERGGPWTPLDVRDGDAVTRALRAFAPRVVVNASVSTAPDTAQAVIEAGAAHVAAAARAHGAHLIHVSSDMVFDGESAPYDEDAPPSPITPYGRSKAEAERRVRAEHPGARVVRSPLLYRMSPPDPSTGTWLEGVRQGQGYALFTDEIRRPAPVEDVAAAIVAIARALVGGENEALPAVMHLPGPEAISRHAFGRLVLAAHGLSPELARASVSGAGGTRPRDLTMLARRTPRAFTAGIRGPRAALPPAPPTSSPARRADRAARRS